MRKWMTFCLAAALLLSLAACAATARTPATQFVYLPAPMRMEQGGTHSTHPDFRLTIRSLDWKWDSLTGLEMLELNIVWHNYSDESTENSKIYGIERFENGEWVKCGDIKGISSVLEHINPGNTEKSYILQCNDDALFDISKPGRYRVWASCYDKQEEEITAWAEFTLSK